MKGCLENKMKTKENMDYLNGKLFILEDNLKTLNSRIKDKLMFKDDYSLWFKLTNDKIIKIKKILK